jgi:hypothetical protein
VTAGWVPIEVTDEVRRCANYARDEWRVGLDSHGEITVTDSKQHESDTGRPLPFEPKPGEVRGRRHTLEFATGYLVGFDAGEWGGSLTWYHRDGSRAQKLGDENVHGLVVLEPDLAISLEGLAHLSINEGAVRWIEKSGATVKAAKPTPLPDEPRTFAQTKTGEVYVLTGSSLVKITPDRRVEVVQPVNTGGLYADSMTIDASDSLWVGMRRFVLRLTPAGNKYTETWFVKQDCQHMIKGDLDCICH